jgi:hypothetical protein
MAAKVLGKAYEEALAEMKVAPPELFPQNREPLKAVRAYDSYSTATFAMS